MSTTALTHHVPQTKPEETSQLTYSFVADGLESAIRQAKAAAGEKDVTIIGAASTAQQTLDAGLADEIQVDIMPLLLCGGSRLFEDLNQDQIRLERLTV